MARVNPETVIDLTGTSLSSETVTLLVDDASTWMDNYLVGVCTDIADDKLEIIERYLACAFVKQIDDQGGQLIQSRRGDIEDRLAPFREGDGPGSVFLRWAAGYDPCGIIAHEFLGEKRAKFRVGAGYDKRHKATS